MAVTDEQRQRIAQAMEPFKLDPTTQADHDKLPQAVVRLIRRARLPKPKHLIWFGNSTAFHTAVTTLNDLNEQVRYGGDPKPETVERLPDVLKDVWIDFREPISDLVSKRLGITWGTAWNRANIDLDYWKRNSYGFEIPRLPGYPDHSAATEYNHYETVNQGVFAARSAAMQLGWLEVCKIESCPIPTRHHTSIKMFHETVKHGGLWFAWEGGVLFCENPTSIRFNAHGRLNNIDGPAVTYPDGTEMYYVNGVSVPKEFITNPESITVSQILAQQNTEIRRLMIEKMGIDKFLKAAQATLVHEDPAHGKLWNTTVLNDTPKRIRPTWENGWRREDGFQPEAWLEVTNSTPEPDGSFRVFFLRVPSRYKTAPGARAWTLQTTKRNLINNLVAET